MLPWFLALGLFALNVFATAHVHADASHDQPANCASCSALHHLGQAVTESSQDLSFFTTVVTNLVLLPGMDHPQFVFNFLPIRGPPSL